MNVVKYISNTDNHVENNSIIRTAIEDFKNTNNLSIEDFIIGGSSCGSYMNYFTLKRVRDVDMFILTERPNLIKTIRSDIIRGFYLADGYQERIIVKDGIQFLSAEDLLINETICALLKLKIRNIEYVGELLRYLNTDVDEFIPIFLKAIETSPSVTGEYLDTINDRIWLLKRWHGSITKV